MAKDIPAPVITEMDKQSQRPVLLAELYLTAATLRFSATKFNITFPSGGNTYTAKTMEVSEVGQTAEDQINRIAVRLDNVAGDMAAYLDVEDFYGKQLVLKRAYIGATGDSSYYNEVFNGFCEEVEEIDRHWVTVPATSGKPLQKRALLDIYQRRCNHVFGDAVCNQDGYSNLASLTAQGTADSGATNYFIDNALTQADDYWNYGRVDIGHSGTTYYNAVLDFVATSDKVIIDVPLTFSMDNTTKYQVWKGCSKTWDACQANNAWGPSSDNKANFKGFIHLSQDNVGDR